ELVATLDPSYHQELSKLTEATAYFGNRVTAAFDRASGVLRIEGTDDADSIRVVQDGLGDVTVPGTPILFIDGPPVTEVSSLPAGMVARVEIRSRGGDDRVVFDDSMNISGVSANAMIFGGPGNDTIYGGLGNDHLDGQGEDDVIFGGPGNDTLYG